MLGLVFYSVNFRLVNEAFFDGNHLRDIVILSSNSKMYFLCDPFS